MFAIKEKNSLHNPTNSAFTPETSSSWNGRMLKAMPASHGGGEGQAVGGGVSLWTVLLVVGIILWAVGASQGNPSMVLAGKVMFGLSFIPMGIMVLACCCLCPIAVSSGSRRY